MDSKRRPPCRSFADLLRVGILLGSWALAGVAPGQAQAPASCKPAHTCDGTYALCIAASCNPETNECGVGLTPDGWVPCYQQAVDDGTCGPCYIFTGTSCSVYEPCSELEEGVLYSTFSETLVNDYGFLWAQASTTSAGMDCMDAVCTATGSTITVNGTEIPTATCQCDEGSAGGFMQVYSCSGDYQSSTWSTANMDCANSTECCPGTDAAEGCS